MTAHAGQIKFDDYKTNLRRLRYRKGILEDYTTRLHYFSDWIIDNSRKGLVKEIGNLYPEWFDGIQTLSISFMSSNPHLYIALQKHPEWIPVIQKQEKDLTGLKIHYLSTEKLCQNPTYLKSLIHDGDILATVTSKTGLDVAHLGFAKWEKGQLYWINASSIYHRVVLDSLPLCKYLKKQPRIKGIRVIRLNLNTICTSVLDNNTLIAG